MGNLGTLECKIGILTKNKKQKNAILPDYSLSVPRAGKGT
jgi:hypothetical protein